MTFTRGGNLFIVAIVGEGGLFTQLTDVKPREQDPRLTASQEYLRREEERLIDYVREEAEKKKKREREEKGKKGGKESAGGGRCNHIEYR